MIRWSYLVPRLAALAIALATVWFVKDPLLRWVVVESGEELVRAKVEVGRLETTVAQGEVELVDVAVADPRAARKNLFEAESVRLSVEPLPLVSRKLVIREGQIHGLRFGTERASSGELPPRRFPGLGLDLPTDEILRGASEAEQRARELLQQWLSQWGGLLGQKLDREFEQLESVRLSRELAERWPAEYRRLAVRLADDKARVDRLRRVVESPVQDPLQQVEQWRQALEELRALEQELGRYAPEVQRLQAQAARDRDALVAAQQRDVERLRQRFRLEAFDAAHLTDYFLGPELGPRVRRVAGWVAWGRAHLPRRVDEGAAPGPQRHRGVEILFPVTGKTPDFLARCLAVDGWVDVADQRYRFEGQVSGLTTQPHVYGQPTTLKLAISGQTPMRVEAVVDHSQAVPRERILFDCPGLPQPERVLGRADEIALTVAAGAAHVWLLLDLQGDRLTGQLQLRQEAVELRPQVAESYGGAAIAKGLQNAASRITTLQVIVDLAGTLEQPRWSIRSDLGPQLGGALNWLVQQELGARQEQVLASIHQRLKQEVVQLDRLLLNEHQQLAGTLQMGHAEVEQLVRLVGQRVPGVGGASGLLGQLPAGGGISPGSGGPGGPLGAQAAQYLLGPAGGAALRPEEGREGVPGGPSALAPGAGNVPVQSNRSPGSWLPPLPATDLLRR